MASFRFRKAACLLMVLLCLTGTIQAYDAADSGEERVYAFSTYEEQTIEPDGVDLASVLEKYRVLCEMDALDTSNYQSEVLGQQTDGRAAVARASDEIYGDTPMLVHQSASFIRAGDIIVCKRPWTDTDLWMMAVTDWDTETETVQVFYKTETGCPVWNTKFFPSNWENLFYVVTRSSDRSGLTEGTVEAAMASFRKQYPSGTVWDKNDFYWSPVLGPSIECASFAFLLSDYIFGCAEQRELENGASLRSGDILELHHADGTCYHWAVVMSVNRFGVQVAEGNYDGRVRYGRWISNAEIARSVVWTRYPVMGSVTDIAA